MATCYGYSLRRWLLAMATRYNDGWSTRYDNGWSTRYGYWLRRWLVCSLLATTMAGLLATRYDDGWSTWYHEMMATRYDDGWSARYGRWLVYSQ